MIWFVTGSCSPAGGLLLVCGFDVTSVIAQNNMFISCMFLGTDGYTHQLCEVETPQDPQAPEFKTARGKGDCKAVVSGLLCGKPVKWEVTFDIQPYLKGREREEKVHEDLWNETFHHLAGRSIIQDFEHMADKECEIEHGKELELMCFIQSAVIDQP